MRRGPQPGSLRWQLERLEAGRSVTVSRRVDGDDGKAAIAHAARILSGTMTSAAYRPQQISGLKFESGEYRTASGDFIVCMTATRISA